MSGQAGTITMEIKAAGCRHLPWESLMSTRLTVPTLAGAIALIGITVAAVPLFGTADAAGPAGTPTIEKSSATSLTLGTAGTKTFTFSMTVTDSSGIKGAKVVTWPKNSNLNPTPEELAHVEDATCTPSSATTSVCTYTFTVDEREDAATIPTGIWHTSVLITANDLEKTFSANAATFTVTAQAD